MARRARYLRLATWGIVGMALGVLLVVVLLNVVARTPQGHEFVLRRTLDALGGSIHGELTIDRISGNLFEGADVYGLRLVDAEGRVFVAADSGRIRYRVTTLLSPRIHIRDALLFDPEVNVFRLPGDTLWNYERIFADTTPEDTTRPRVERVVRIDTLRARDGVVRVRLPWEPDPALGERARREELAAALSDTGRIVVDSVPGGYLWTITFDALQARLSRIRFAPGSELGSRFEVDSLSARAQVFRDPADLRAATGAVALLPGHVELDFPSVRLPRSLLSVSGVVRTADFPPWFDEEEAPMYDLAFRSDSVHFSDLLWLYPLFPEEAVGALSFRIESRPEGTLFLARDATVAAPSTRIRGSFGMILGDTLRFVDVDVEADPVDVPLIESMLPEGLPVRGLRLGGVEIRGTSVDTAPPPL